MIALALVVAFASQPHGRPVEPLVTPQSAGPGVKVAVEWSGVRATDGCFFFSGPNRLGRDDDLGRTACVSTKGPVRVDFGAARFTGTADRVTRRSTHAFHGTWTASEALEGTFAPDGRFNGRYRYAECAAGRACPGPCRIDAQVRFTPVGRCGGEPKGAPTS